MSSMGAIVESERRASAGNQAGRAAYFLLVSYFVVEYVRPQNYFAGISFLKPGLLVGGALFFYWIIKSDKQELKHSLVKMYIAFVVLSSLSIVFSLNTYWGFQSARNLATYLVAAVLPMAFIVRDAKQIRRFFDTWILIHFVVAIMGIINGGKGPGSFLGDENDLALAVAMAIPYAYFSSQAADISAIRKWWYWITMAVFVAAVVATGSRGGFLGLIATAIGIVIFSSRKLKNAVILAICATCLYLVIPADYKHEIESISDQNDGTREQRMYLWRRGWEMYVDNPIFGVGAGNYPWNIGKYELLSDEYEPDRMRSMGGRPAHSLYLTLLSESGTIGSLLFWGMVFLMFSRLKRVVDRSTEVARRNAVLLAQAIIVSSVSFLVSAAFVSVLYYPHFWYLIGFTIALERASCGIRRTGKKDGNKGTTNGRKCGVGLRNDGKPKALSQSSARVHVSPDIAT